MRILQYSNCPLDPSLGSGKTRLRFSSGLRALGHDVRVIEPAAFELWPALRSGKRFRQAMGALRHARRALAGGAVDLVEINGGEFGWLARNLRRRGGPRPLVVHRTDGCELLNRPAGAPPRGMVGRAHGALDRASFRDADACVALCRMDIEHLVAAGYQHPDRTRVAPPGLDDEFLAHAEPDPRPARLAFLGSWIERKGVGALAAATAAVMAEVPALEIDLLGTGGADARASYPEAVRARVHVAGRLSTAELSRRLAGSSIFAFPSRYEGFGMAVAEAMACGCAVVTTRTGFGGDLKDGEDALLVGFDDPGALAIALRRLVSDDGLRLRVARSGWRRIQACRWAESVRILESSYLSWLPQGREAA
jgi:glycosyltransferase involved in cell wall biosynthesis